MTERDIQILLEFHADQLDHIRRTIEGLKHDTLKLLESIEDEKIEPFKIRGDGKNSVAKKR